MARHSTKKRSASNVPLSHGRIANYIRLHGFKTRIVKGRIYGYMPYIMVNTRKRGIDVTDLTGYTLTMLREYLGY